MKIRKAFLKTAAFIFAFAVVGPVSAYAETYLYDDFEDGVIDNVKWFWSNGNEVAKPDSAEGKLNLHVTNASPDSILFFSYRPNTIKAKITVESVNGADGAYAGSNIVARWLADRNYAYNDDKRVVSRIGIKAYFGSGSMSLKIVAEVRSSEKVDGEYKFYSKKEQNAQIGTTYTLKMEKTESAINFYIDNSLFSTFNYQSCEGCSFPDCENCDCLELGEVHYTNALKRELFIGSYCDSSRYAEMISRVDTVSTDVQLHPNVEKAGYYQVRNPEAGVFDVPEKRYFVDCTNTFLKDSEFYFDYNKCPGGVNFPAFENIAPSGEFCSGQWSDLECAMISSSRVASLDIHGERNQGRQFLDALKGWAERDFLKDYIFQDCPTTPTQQDWYNVNWFLCTSGIVYSIVNDHPDFSETEKRAVNAWLNDTVRHHLSYSCENYSGRNNHLFWNGLMAAIVGVVTDDDAFFDFGVRTYLRALDMMDEDGCFPLELLRDENAIHYQSFALLPLVFIAEIAERQGYDIYSESRGAKNIHLAILFLMEIIENSVYFENKQNELYANPFVCAGDCDYEVSYNEQTYFDKSIWSKGYILSWVEPYQARFGNDALRVFLTNQGLRREDGIFQHHFTGGSATLHFHLPEPAGGGVDCASKLICVGTCTDDCDACVESISSGMNHVSQTAYVNRFLVRNRSLDEKQAEACKKIRIEIESGKLTLAGE